MRAIKGDFIVTGVKFKSRREARDWCKTHHPGSPITEIGPGGKRAASKTPPERPSREERDRNPFRPSRRAGDRRVR
jgi:hypothetical protein